MGNNARNLLQLAACAAGMVMLSSCSTWTNRYRPIDIDASMPRASELVQGVQKAIDDTDNHLAWDTNGYFTRADAACKANSSAAQKAQEAACKTAYETARHDCRKVKGVAGPSLCADFFRQATQSCAAAAAGEPPECAIAKLIAPPRITEAKLQLTAAVESGAGASVEYLTLLSAKASRKQGRKHTLEITLIPRDALVRQYQAAAAEVAARSTLERSNRTAPVSASRELKNAARLAPLPLYESREPEQQTPISSLARSLSGALTVALNAALVNDETAPKERQLTLKRMFYQFEIDYTREVGGGFKWTVAPISAAVEGSKGSQSGNIVTIEVVR